MYLIGVCELFCFRTCYFTSDSANQKVKFISQLTKYFGQGGGFMCALTTGFFNLLNVRMGQLLKFQSEQLGHTAMFGYSMKTLRCLQLETI